MGSSQKPALGGKLSLVRARPRLNPSPPSPSLSLAFCLTTCTLRNIRAPQSSSQGLLAIASTVTSISAWNRRGIDRVLCDTSNGLFTPSAVWTHWSRKGLLWLLLAAFACLLGIPRLPQLSDLNPNPNPSPPTQPTNLGTQKLSPQLPVPLPHFSPRPVADRQHPKPDHLPTSAHDKAATPRAIPLPSPHFASTQLQKQSSPIPPVA